MKIFEKLGFVTPKEEVTPKKPTPVVQITPVITTNTSSIGIVDSNPLYSKVLEDALNKKDLPGPDFLEFYKTLKGLQSSPFTEQQKYQTALIGLATLGLTKEKIIETSDIYLKAIDEESVNFSQIMEKYKKTEIQDKLDEISKLTLENQNLQKKMQENIQKVAKLTEESNANSQNANIKIQQFSSATQNEKNTITTIITNVKTYL
jgi:regulator of replication initiation timing